MFITFTSKKEKKWCTDDRNQYGKEEVMFDSFNLKE